MPIEMPRGLPFSVDTFGPYTKTNKKRYHFLTHAHKDHTSGISSTADVFPIYATPVTISLLLRRCPQLDKSFFASIDVGQSLCIDDPDGEFRVTAFDANHCPGAVMFLFEGKFGNILHTGDCRLNSECLKSLPDKYVGRQGKEPQCCLDCIFLDCTFGRFSQRLPSKHSAIRQIINCIWKHPDAPVVYLACDLLGQEDILLEVSRTFGSRIYVDEAANQECFRSLMFIAPEILSRDPSSRFHIFEGFPKLYDRASAKLAEAKYKLQPMPLIIRASAQWYVYDSEEFLYSGTQSQKQRKARFNEAVRDEFGVWHVCYSSHSSREELGWALQLLSPKWVVSTTPTCRAMELDYVRKNCFVSRISSDDPFWKLLDIDVRPSSDTIGICNNAASCCPVVGGPTQESSNSLLESMIKYSPVNKLLGLSPERSPRSLPVTLFGRARLSFEESNKLYKKKTISTGHEYAVLKEASPELEKLNLKEVEPLQDVTNETQKVEPLVEDAYANANDENESMNISRVTMENQCCRDLSSSMQSCRSLSNNLRKLYRSMNAPVPQPLPSLVELMNARKRSRKQITF